MPWDSTHTSIAVGLMLGVGNVFLILYPRRDTVLLKAELERRDLAVKSALEERDLAVKDAVETAVRECHQRIERLEAELKDLSGRLMQAELRADRFKQRWLVATGQTTSSSDDLKAGEAK